MSKIFFSVASLIMGNDRFFSLSDFDGVQGEEDIKIEEDDNKHVTITEVEFIDHEFFCIYFKEGNTKPMPPEVFNTRDGHIEANPKKDYQAEMYTQTFVLIQPQEQRIFLSDYRKKEKVREWLDNRVNYNPVVIDDIIDEENFIKGLKSLHSVYFSRERSLFDDVTLDNELIVLGDEAIPLKIEVKTTLDPISLTKGGRENIKKFLLMSRKRGFGKVIISGSTHEGFNRFFNTGQIVDKIAIKAKKMKDGLYKKEDVFSNLIESIKNHDKSIKNHEKQ